MWCVGEKRESWLTVLTQDGENTTVSRLRMLEFAAVSFSLSLSRLSHSFILSLSLPHAHTHSLSLSFRLLSEAVVSGLPGQTMGRSGGDICQR